MERGLLFLEAGRPCEIAIAHQVLHEALVGRPRGEIAAAPHAQGLIDRLTDRGNETARHRHSHGQCPRCSRSAVCRSAA